MPWTGSDYKTLSMCRRVFFILSVSTLGLLVCACGLQRDTRPSVLVIAVENLAFDSFSCESDEVLPGFDIFCEEAIRFTHAFTPSTMSQSALASVFTASHPSKHGVHDNGSDYLSGRFRTLAEVAVEKGYRTAFVSGGPPIFKKSGLGQGFEWFDDSFDLSWNHYYRASSDVTSLFADWLTKEVELAPYFAVLFLADLQFPSAQTFTPKGELREQTAAAQLESIGDSLQKLSEVLRSSKRWSSTAVVLMGLNGPDIPSDLKSDNTQVALMIKPPSSLRAPKSSWAIDTNVSLIDVGQTIFEWFGESPGSDDEILDRISLQSALNSTDANLPNDRIIYTESGWTSWRLGQTVRMALRKKQFLFINDEMPLLFNSLTDRDEKHPLSLREPLWQSVSSEVLSAAQRLQPLVKPKVAMLKPNEIALGRALTESKLDRSQVSEPGKFVDLTHPDSRVADWIARWALESKRWSLLGKVAGAFKNPLWEFVAATNLNSSSTLNLKHDCLPIFKGSQISGTCNDEGLLSLIRWIGERSSEERVIKKEKVFRILAADRMLDRLGQLHLYNYVKWDIRLDYPRGPSPLELYLALPMGQAYALQLEKLFNAKNLSF